MSSHRYSTLVLDTPESLSFELHNLTISGELIIDGKKCTADHSAPLSVLKDYHRFAGQFFIVEQSIDSGSVTLVNDVMGVQPCYYTVRDNTVIVSKSLANIKQHIGDLAINQQGIFDYFYHHCIPAPNTIYQGVYKLEPGVAVTIDNQGEILRQNLYQPAFAQQADNIDALRQQCASAVEQAVADHVSPECGAFLSGGLDSSTVAGYLAKHAQNAKTFSIGFRAKEYDETEFAQITARHFGTDHQVLYLEPDEAIKEFKAIAQYYEEPFGNSSAMAAYFCARFAKQYGVTTMLAGDGGDELFAGNTRYVKQQVFSRFTALPGVAQRGLRALFCNALMDKVPVAKKVASYIRQASVPMPARMETYNYVNKIGCQRLFTDEFLAQVDTDLPARNQQRRYEECTSPDMVDKMLYLDWKFTLADNDLVKVGRMCERAGVKVVYPFMDKRVVDFSCTVPASVKLPDKQLRKFYKDSFQGFLHPSTLSKSKHGFGLPFGVWIKEHPQMNDIAMQAIQDFKGRGILNNDIIEQVLADHQSVHAGYYGEMIWLIVVLELWLQAHA